MNVELKLLNKYFVNKKLFENKIEFCFSNL